MDKLTKEQGLEMLVDVIEHDKRHQDYGRVIELADKYFKMFTGKDIVDLLIQITTRVTNEEFDQLKRIYKSNIPSTLNSTMLPFQKALRKQPLIRELKYQSKNDAAVAELEDKIATYWGDKSLEEYLEYAYIEYNYHDPNAFIITEFEQFDNKKEKASPYPFVATSTDAIMFEYKNELLKYLIIRLPIEYLDYKEGRNELGQDILIDTMEPGWKYTMYLGYDTIQLTQVGKNGYNVEVQEGQELIKIGPWDYLVEYFTPKADKVPAQRVGYKRDAETAGRTFVSVFHPVLLLIEKVIKTDSELDLSMSLTAFPKRYQYVDRCSGKDCNGGYLPNNDACPICKGTGWRPLHGSTTDVTTLPMPHNPEEIVDLNQLFATDSPPVELLQFMADFEDSLVKKIYAKMFNAELFSQSEVQVAATATEKILETDNMNDTLFPFARNYSALWEYIVLDIAAFTDNSQGLTVHHKFPTDFKFKSLTELMSELKSAKDAGASTSTIAAIEDDINELLYSDRPNDLKKIRIKNMVNPFRGYSEANVRLLISQGKTTKFNETLWSNLESIFNELELANPGIYDMNYVKIVEAVKLKTEEYMALIESEKPEPVASPFTTE